MCASGKLLRETYGDTTLDFFYSTSGQPYALSHNGMTYYYITNLQGDVMSIVDGTGAVVAEYEYDPYGNILSTTGTLADTLGQINPRRYRGYVYDQECNLYYLQSRYYDPSISRFLNADAYASTGQGIIGNNMFAYCQNNPVANYDPSGHSSTSSIEQFFSEIFDILNRLIKTIVHYFGPFSDDEKVLIATIAAEGTVTVNGEPVSSSARQAMANVALNRVGSREWSKYKTEADICKETGFDGYGGKNYQQCMDYLNNRDFSNKVYEQVIWDVMKAYSYDITDGCQLYYTPAAMSPAGSVPKWNFGLLTEVSIPGVDPYYEARFFKYS